MKGSLSVLSAAVLMALAASGSDSNAANASSLNGVRSLRPGTPGHIGNGGPARGIINPTGSVPSRSGVSPGKHGRAKAPNGNGSILYDQFGNDTSHGQGAEAFDPNSSYASWAADSADDFVVGAGGWTVTGFNFLAYNGHANLLTEPADIYVYPDENGLPGPVPVCSSPNSSNSPTTYEQFETLTAITLNEPCDLDAGRYWVSVAYVNPLHGDNFPFRVIISLPPVGYVGAYRNPANAFGENCIDWTPAPTCNSGSLGPYDYSFQVLGTAGGSDGITLDLTLAEDDGTGTNCGTATSLTANVGDRVNLCYSVTNNSPVALTYHSLMDSQVGEIFSLVPIDLEPGATYHYNRVITASSANNGAISAVWTAQDGVPGYQSDATGPSQFVDISATGTNLGLVDDTKTAVTLPFSFNFYGEPTNLLLVSNNGGMRVGTDVGLVLSTNSELPEQGNPKPAMFPLWDDFDSETGGVYTQTIGNFAGSRKFYIEWFNRPHYDGTENTDTATFEVVIDEASGNFSFEYDDVDYTANGALRDPPDCNGGLCATIGVEDNATQYTQYSFDTASVSNGTSIAWSPTVVDNIFTDSARATLNVIAPLINVTPASLQASVPSAGSGASALTIANGGDAALDFSVGEATHSHSGLPAITHPFVRKPRNPNQTAGKHAARLAGKDGKPLFPGYRPSPDGTVDVPAFAYAPGTGDFVSFDPTAPALLNPINAIASDPLPLGGTFIDNDFTTEYVVTLSGSTGANELATIDTATGVLTSIGPLTGAAGSVFGLSWDPTSGTLYAAGTDTGGSGSQLYTVDPSTGALTAGADVADVTLGAIAFDGTGTIYGLDYNTASILAIDKATGDAQQLVALPIMPMYAQDIDIDLATNTLYYPSFDKYVDNYNGEMYAIDLATAVIRDVGPVGDGSAELTAFAVEVAGSDCLMAADVPWLSQTPANGTIEPQHQARVTVNYDASTLADGVYAANVCIRSNDPANGNVDVPVSLTVGNPDVIFKNGFDGASTSSPVSFVEDDGSFENAIGINNQTTEAAAVWLNRFTLGAGQFPLTLSDVQIEWPNADNANGDLTGLAVNILVYYDADGDGDPGNAIKVFEGPATIDSIASFQTYPISAAISGGGDIYVGFENAYAEGGASPGLLFPAALDQNSGSAHNSYLSFMTSGDPDLEDLGDNSFTGTIDDLNASLAGNWLIRADGQTSTGAPVILR